MNNFQLSELKELGKTLDLESLESFQYLKEATRLEEQSRREIALAQYKEDKTNTFRIAFMRKNIIGETALESFHIEGIDNALVIFDTYRKSGHELKLHNLTIKRGEDELIKKINFIYRGEK